MPPLGEVPNQLRGRPFTRTKAILCGITGAMLRGKRFRRIFTGVYVEDRVPDSDALRFDAARLIAPDCWAMCHAAAGIYGFPVPPEPLTHIGLPAGGTWPRDPRLRRHRHEGSPVIVRLNGRPVSCPTDVFLRLAEHLSLLDLVVVGDAMVRRDGRLLGSWSRRRTGPAGGGCATRAEQLAWCAREWTHRKNRAATPARVRRIPGARDQQGCPRRGRRLDCLPGSCVPCLEDCS